jgi:hypothetical protein
MAIRIDAECFPFRSNALTKKAQPISMRKRMFPPLTVISNEASGPFCVENNTTRRVQRTPSERNLLRSSTAKFLSGEVSRAHLTFWLYARTDNPAFGLSFGLRDSVPLFFLTKKVEQKSQADFDAETAFCRTFPRPKSAVGNISSFKHFQLGSK